MKLLSWNCKGLGNPRTVRALKKLIANNHPDIIFLMDTKLNNIPARFKDKFAASYSFYSIDCSSNWGRGKSGGIILLRDPCICNIDIIDIDFNYVDVIVTNCSDSMQWRVTGVYGYPQHQNKHLTCRLMNTYLTHTLITIGSFLGTSTSF
jgi:exonuclease III